MSRTFKTVDDDQALDLTVRLGDCLPPEHLARFVVDSVAQLDLSALYGHYGSRGGEPYAPEVLLGLLLYGYATGGFSSRKIERATYEAVPFRFIAGNLHPDHDTLAPSCQNSRSSLCRSSCSHGRQACGNSGRSVWMGQRCMRMPPSVKRSATSACWSWRHNCKPRSRSSLPSANSSTSE